MVNSRNEHENPNLYITVINQSDNVWTALLNRLNYHWSLFFILSVKTPETNSQNDQRVLPVLETLYALLRHKKHKGEQTKMLSQHKLPEKSHTRNF